MTEADLQKRVAETFHAVCQRMNDNHAYQAMMKAPEPDTLDRRQEKLALIRELRDQTNSRATYERCVAIVGERGA